MYFQYISFNQIDESIRNDYLMWYDKEMNIILYNIEEENACLHEPNAPMNWNSFFQNIIKKKKMNQLFSFECDTIL